MITKANLVARKIRERRKELSMSQRDLSEKSGLVRKSHSFKYLSNIERGKCQLAPVHIVSVANILHVDPMDLAELMVEDFKNQIIDLVRNDPKLSDVAPESDTLDLPIEMN